MKVQDASIAHGKDENARSPGDPALLDLAELLAALVARGIVGQAVGCLKVKFLVNFHVFLLAV